DADRSVGIPVEQLPDDALLAGYTAGDDELTVAFVRRFQSRVFGVALAVLGDVAAAEDVAQQAFERVWRHGHAFDERRGSVSAWLSAIARNLAIDAMRVRRPLPVDPDVLLAGIGAGADSPEHSALLGESSTELRAALRELPAEQTRAIVLAGIAGLSASQVAAREGIPLGTAKTRIRTAMQRLRAALVPSGAER
ncbi:MAG TPA: sigma-70 family RNA polymerase sigma factor, partial [Acidimicrobiales bacterium]|nr:sigma-70 family RNA polymerase sigma factor [Acidimicrobiales bacterium]